MLIANAALPASGRIEDFSVEQIDRALAVNLRAPIILARALAPQMSARGGGHIALISSLSGKSAQAGSSLYSATKFGLRGFGLGLREDWRDRGVGVSVVFPGFIRDAGMLHESGAKLPPGVGTRTPREVADATLRAVERNKARGRRRPGQPCAAEPWWRRSCPRCRGGSHASSAPARSRAISPPGSATSASSALAQEIARSCARSTMPMKGDSGRQ